MPDDDRLPMARAYQRATRGITVAAGMVVPGLLGYWADSRWGTGALFTISGFALGMAYGLYELVRMSRSAIDNSNGAVEATDEAEPSSRRDNVNNVQPERNDGA